MAAIYNGPARTPEEMLPVFRRQFSEFSSVGDLTVILNLELATIIFGACEIATLYLTAHLLAEANASGIGTPDADLTLNDSGGAPVTSARVGDLTASFASLASEGKPLDNTFVTTVYGRNFLRFREVCPGYTLAGGVVGGDFNGNIYGGLYGC